MSDFTPHFEESPPKPAAGSGSSPMNAGKNKMAPHRKSGLRMTVVSMFGVHAYHQAWELGIEPVGPDCMGQRLSQPSKSGILAGVVEPALRHFGVHHHPSARSSLAAPWPGAARALTPAVDGCDQGYSYGVRYTRWFRYRSVDRVLAAERDRVMKPAPSLLRRLTKAVLAALILCGTAASHARANENCVGEDHGWYPWSKDFAFDLAPFARLGKTNMRHSC